MLKKIRKMLKQQEGFTLVELMIVVVILGILAGVGIQQYGAVQQKARITAHNANVRVIHGAAQMYLIAGGTATDDIEVLIGKKVSGETATYDGPKYLEEVPKLPITLTGENPPTKYSLKIEGDETTGYTIAVTPPVQE